MSVTAAWFLFIFVKAASAPLFVGSYASPETREMSRALASEYKEVKLAQCLEVLVKDEDAEEEEAPK